MCRFADGWLPSGSTDPRVFTFCDGGPPVKARWLVGPRHPRSASRRCVHRSPARSDTWQSVAAAEQRRRERHVHFVDEAGLSTAGSSRRRRPRARPSRAPSRGPVDAARFLGDEWKVVPPYISSEAAAFGQHEHRVCRRAGPPPASSVIGHAAGRLHMRGKGSAPTLRKPAAAKSRPRRSSRPSLPTSSGTFALQRPWCNTAARRRRACSRDLVGPAPKPSARPRRRPPELGHRVSPLCVFRPRRRLLRPHPACTYALRHVQQSASATSRVARSAQLTVGNTAAPMCSIMRASRPLERKKKNSLSRRTRERSVDASPRAGGVPRARRLSSVSELVATRLERPRARADRMSHRRAHLDQHQPR